MNLLKTDNLKDFIFAFMLFFSTLYKIPNYIFIIIFIYGYFIYGVKIKDLINNIGKTNFYLLTIIYLLIFINFYFFIPRNIEFIDKKIIPFLSVYPIVIMIAYWINKRILKYLLYLLSLHAVFVILEKILGINTVFVFHEEFRNNLWNVSLYSSRPFGLSSGINSCGLILLSGLVILVYLKNEFSRNIFTFLLLLFLTAIDINFSRSVVIAVAFFLFFAIIYKKISLKYIFLVPAFFIFLYYFYFNIIDIYHSWFLDISIIKLLAKSIVFLSFGFIYMILLSLFFEFILRILNLKRLIIIILIIFVGNIVGKNIVGKNIVGKNIVGRNVKDVMSYRDIIYKQAIKDIKENPIRGNFSRKDYVYLKAYDRYEHMHNSFLVMITSEGIVIFLLVLYFIYRNINSENWLFVLTILITGLFQYSFFWGMSYLDIILMYFLLYVKKDIDFYAKI